MKAQFNRLNHCVFNLHDHLVFVTKYRRQAITKPMLAGLKEIFTGAVKKFDGDLIEFNGEADHVHLLTQVASYQKHLNRRDAEMQRMKIKSKLQIKLNKKAKVKVNFT